MAVHHRRRGVPSCPDGPPPPPRPEGPSWDKTTFAIGKLWSGHFWCTSFWIPDPSPLSTPPPLCDVIRVLEVQYPLEAPLRRSPPLPVASPALTPPPPRLGDEAYETASIKNTARPKWLQTFIFTVRDPHDITLHFALRDTADPHGAGDITGSLDVRGLPRNTHRRSEAAVDMRPTDGARAAHRTAQLKVSTEIVEDGPEGDGAAAPAESAWPETRGGAPDEAPAGGAAGVACAAAAGTPADGAEEDATSAARATEEEVAAAGAAGTSSDTTQPGEGVVEAGAVGVCGKALRRGRCGAVRRAVAESGCFLVRYTTLLQKKLPILLKMHACRRCAHLWATSDFVAALGVWDLRECRGDVALPPSFGPPRKQGHPPWHPPGAGGV